MEHYVIRLEGELDSSWSEWLCGMEIGSGAPGETVVRGPLADQAAVYGLLARLRDLGLPLLSLERVDPCSVD